MLFGTHPLSAFPLGFPISLGVDYPDTAICVTTALLPTAPPPDGTYPPTALSVTTAVLPVTITSRSMFKLLPGFVSDGTRVYIPIASLVGVSAAEADADTGDIREVLQGLLLRIVEYMDGTFFTNTFATDIQDSVYSHPQLGQVLKHEFTIGFPITYAGANVVDEP